MKKVTKIDVMKIKANYKLLTYKEKEEMYKVLDNNICYGCSNESDFIQIFGYSFNQIEGYEELEDKIKTIVYEGLLSLCSTGGLEYKADMLVYKVEPYNSKKIKLYHCEGYSWLYMDGSIG